MVVSTDKKLKEFRGEFQWEDHQAYNDNIRPSLGYKREYRDGEPWNIRDEPIIPVLEKALEFVNGGGSLRDAARWVSKEIGYSVSHTSINNLWKRQKGDDGYSPRNKKLNAQRKNSRNRTPEEKRKEALLRKQSAARRSLSVTRKRLKEMGVDSKEHQTDSYVEEKEKNDKSFSGTFYENQGVDNPEPGRHIQENNNTFPAQDIEDGVKDDKTPNVIFRPNPGPQYDFLSSPEQEVLYGGSAGGGKSYALLADPVRYFENKNFNGLLLRRTNDELRELKWKSKELYLQLYPKAKWSEKESTWTFPSGARLWMSYLERDEDVLRYQGQAFTWIGIDELTQYATPFAWNYLRSRLRTTDPNLPLSQRGTTNPGGPGHGWVKAMFVDPSPSNLPFPATDLETGLPMVYPPRHEKAGKPLFKRKFIPASLYDNPYLLQDGSYEASLLSLPEQQRRQLLEGDWNIADGAAFPEFRVKSHVIEPYEIPREWRKFRSCDYGYSSYSAVHWYAIDPAYETIVVYRELYVSKHTGRDLARAILELEADENISYGVLDSSVWHQRGQVGPSIAEEMIAEGCRWRPADRSKGSRTAGKNRLHELLKVEDLGDIELPGIVFFNTCRQIIADLGVIPVSPKGTEDIDDRYTSDHTYDSIRYGIMSRPRSTTMQELTGFSSEKWRPSDSKFGY